MTNNPPKNPLPYTTYSEYLQRLFPGEKIQKISINAGFSCPNRDGTIGRGGCIYCDNSSFTPSYCMTGDNAVSQLRAGKAFFGRKYPEMRFLAYFQSFTNTFTKEISELENLYRSVAEEEGVAGIIVGTRPDCLPEGVLEILERIGKEMPVIVEIGAETSFDHTLQRINRRHTWGDVCNAVSNLAERGLHPGLHLICGLPGETPDMMLQTTEKAATLPIETVKFHQMQVIKETELARLWLNGEAEIHPFSLESYLDFCEEVVKRIPSTIAIERFLASAPPDKVLFPKWGIKNYQFVNLLHNRLCGVKN